MHVYIRICINVCIMVYNVRHGQNNKDYIWIWTTEATGGGLIYDLADWKGADGYGSLVENYDLMVISSDFW